MGIITFLKKRYKEHLLKKVDELKKLSDSYFDSSQAYKEMIDLIDEHLLSCKSVVPLFMHYNPFLLDVPTPINIFDMYVSNYLYYTSRHNCTKLKVERLEKRIEKL